MSKEEGLKKVELKVHVNCCDGCKKKVLKALNIKGVLKTEIHPTLPKVTVTGTVDVGVLIKKLSKCGKASEPLQTESNILFKKNSDGVKELAESSEKKKEIVVVPRASCSVNHGAAPARFQSPEAFGVPMPPCYSIVAGPCCGLQQCWSYGVVGVPAVHQNFLPVPAMVPPVSSPEGAGIADYFNDENTVGCHVM